jgi:hypothetical protein
MPSNEPDELADFVKGGGRIESHKAPRIRLLFAKNTKLIPVLVVTSGCGFRSALKRGKLLNLKR